MRLVALSAVTTYLNRKKFQQNTWIGIKGEAERQKALARWRFLQAQYWQEHFEYLEERTNNIKTIPDQSSLLFRRQKEYEKHPWCYKLPNFKALLNSGKLNVAVSQVKRFWTDFILWVFIAGVLSSILLLQRDDRTFHLNNLYRKLFIDDFENIKVITEYWDSLENSLLPFIFKENINARQEKFFKLGAIRVWQVRLKYVKCPLTTNIHIQPDHCIPDETSVKSSSFYDNGNYQPYWETQKNESEEKKVFDEENSFIANPWSYKSLDGTLASRALVGNNLLRSFYPLGGFIVDLRYEKESVEAILEGLRSTMWIDKRTSAIFTEMALYSNNSHLISSIFLAVEALSHGNIKVYHEINTYKPPYLYSYKDLAVAVMQLVHILISMGLLFHVIKQCHEVKWSRRGVYVIAFSFWNFLSLISMILSLCAYSLYFAFIYYSNAVNRLYKADKSAFTYFSTPARYEKFYFHLLAFAAFVSCMRLIKVFRCSPTVTVMIDALYFAREELFNVWLSVFIIVSAYASLWTLSFGYVSLDFLNFGEALSSLYGLMAGLPLSENNKNGFYVTIFILFMLLSMVFLVNMYSVAVESGYIKMRVLLSQRSWDPIESLSMIWLYDKILITFGVSPTNSKLFRVCSFSLFKIKDNFF